MPNIIMDRTEIMKRSNLIGIVCVSVPRVHCESHRVSPGWIFIFISLLCSWIVHTLEMCLKN